MAAQQPQARRVWEDRAGRVHMEWVVSGGYVIHSWLDQLLAERITRMMAGLEEPDPWQVAESWWTRWRTREEE